MASTLIVEDGTGVAGADSFVTLAECTAWNEKFYGHALTGSDAVKDAALRRAAAWLSTYLANASSIAGFAGKYKWKGERTFGRSQPLAWPRTGVTDAEGNAIGANEIPVEVKNAQHILARVEFQSPGVLTPEINLSKIVQREKVGPLERSYFGAPEQSAGTADIASFRPEITAAIDNLKGLLEPDVAYPAALTV